MLSTTWSATSMNGSTTAPAHSLAAFMQELLVRAATLASALTQEHTPTTVSAYGAASNDLNRALEVGVVNFAVAAQGDLGDVRGLFEHAQILSCRLRQIIPRVSGGRTILPHFSVQQITHYTVSRHGISGYN